MSGDSKFKGPFIFEKGKDPGTGHLRIVADLCKLEIIESKRLISINEIYEVVFGMGRSLHLEEFFHESEVNGKIFRERRFKSVGLTNAGKPLIVIIATGADSGLKKKIVTAWRTSRTGVEVTKLLEALPHLKEELIKD
jgi:hypothetical protein